MLSQNVNCFGRTGISELYDVCCDNGLHNRSQAELRVGLKWLYIMMQKNARASILQLLDAKMITKIKKEYLEYHLCPKVRSKLENSKRYTKQE